MQTVWNLISIRGIENFFRPELLALLLCCQCSALAVAQPIVWELDNLSTIGGHTVQVLGNPQVVTLEGKQAIAFDGVDDGLLMPVNLLEGVTTFTIEILIRPDADGAFEQRYFHAQESLSEDRMLLELRAEGGTWYQDTFVRRGGVNYPALIDPLLRHSLGAWHHVAAVYDGTILSHYVDGVLLMQSQPIPLTPLRSGQTSLGVRQNLISSYKGAIAWVRLTPDALEPGQFTGVPGRGGRSSFFLF